MYWKMSLEINSEKCIHCGLCAQVCKNRAIEMDKATGMPVVAPDGGEDRCMHCQQCMMICPAGALTIDGVRPEDCPKASKAASWEDVRDLVQSRRSVRDYLQKDVDPAVISDLLDAVRYAPTGVNRQGLHYSVIDKISVMNRYRAMVYESLGKLFSMDPVPDAVQKYRGVWDQYCKGGDPVFRTAPHMIVVSVPKDAPCINADPIIALSYFELLAQAHGLGTVWLGRIMMMYEQILPNIFDPFDIPATHQPGYAMLFGKTALKYQRVKQPAAANVMKIDLAMLQKRGIR